METPYIGARISLISKSEIRYEARSVTAKAMLSDTQLFPGRVVHHRYEGE